MALASEGEPVAETLLSRCARPRPRLVCVDGRVVGDAVVVVSEEDPNWWRGMAVRRNGEIRVRVSRVVRFKRRA
jgi:hypothetical protein